MKQTIGIVLAIIYFVISLLSISALSSEKFHLKAFVKNVTIAIEEDNPSERELVKHFSTLLPEKPFNTGYLDTETLIYRFLNKDGGLELVDVTPEAFKNPEKATFNVEKWCIEVAP